MNKNKKIEALNIIQSKIDYLKKLKRNSAEFKAWLSNSETLLCKVFGDETVYIKNFKNIKYTIYNLGNISEEELQAKYQKGLDEANILIQSYIENIMILDSDEEEIIDVDGINQDASNKIFIVHGRDDVAKLEVARYLEKLKLQPIILHEQANEGKTIIEKIETYTDVKYAVVLYTPCDIGGLKGSSSEELKDRARQNVVFEHGYLMGKIGRNKVSALVKGSIETPNDISGVVYISMTEGNWQINLAKELKAAGYEIDFNVLFE